MLPSLLYRIGKCNLKKILNILTHQVKFAKSALSAGASMANARLILAPVVASFA